jgi:hypothetical protein
LFNTKMTGILLFNSRTLAWLAFGAPSYIILLIFHGFIQTWLDASEGLAEACPHKMSGSRYLAERGKKPNQHPAQSTL